MNLSIDRIPKPFRPAAVLGAIAVMLTLVLAAEGLLLNLGDPEIPRAPAKSQTNSEQDSSPEEFELPGEDEYDQMVSRPLFMERRQPGQAPAQTVETSERKPATPMTFKLMGIITTPTKKAALLVDAKGKYRRLKLNDALDGWELVELEGDKVILEQNDKKETLQLLKKRPVTPAPAAGKAAANPAPKKTADEDEEEIPADDENIDMEGTEDQDMMSSDDEGMSEEEATASEE